MRFRNERSADFKILVFFNGPTTLSITTFSLMTRSITTFTTTVTKKRHSLVVLLYWGSLMLSVLFWVSNAVCLMPSILCWVSYAECLMPSVLCRVSYAECLMLSVLCWVSYAQCLMLSVIDAECHLRWVLQINKTLCCLSLCWMSTCWVLLCWLFLSS